MNHQNSNSESETDTSLHLIIFNKITALYDAVICLISDYKTTISNIDFSLHWENLRAAVNKTFVGNLKLDLQIDWDWQTQVILALSLILVINLFCIYFAWRVYGERLSDQEHLLKPTSSSGQTKGK